MQYVVLPFERGLLACLVVLDHAIALHAESQESWDSTNPETDTVIEKRQAGIISIALISATILVEDLL